MKPTPEQLVGQLATTAREKARLLAALEKIRAEYGKKIERLLSDQR